MYRPCCKDLIQEVGQCHGQLEITATQVRVVCTLTPSVINFKNLKKDWEATVKGCVEAFLSDKIVEKESIELDEGGQEVFAEFKSFAQNGKISSYYTVIVKHLRLIEYT